MHRIKLQIIALIGCVALFAGCKPQYPGNIPVVDVDITINVLDPSFVQLQAVGGAVEIPGGSKGIIVYRVSIDQFNAYERHCTYDSGDCGRVSIADNDVMMIDDDCFGEACGSIFNIIDGSIMNGPAQYPLVQYTTQFDGVSMLRIYN